MIERAEMLAKLISLENGKALRDARGEVAYAAEFFRWYAEEAVRINGEFGIAPSRRQPHPRRIPADRRLRADHAVEFPGRDGDAQDRAGAGRRLHRHPEARHGNAADSICSGRALQRGRRPRGVVNVHHHHRRPGPSTAPCCTIRACASSPSPGRPKSAAHCCRGGETRAELLDGTRRQRPFIVFDDADLDAAVEGAMVAKMRNAGEACTAANRLYVQAGIYPRHSSRLDRAHGGAPRRTGH